MRARAGWIATSHAEVQSTHGYVVKGQKAHIWLGDMVACRRGPKTSNFARSWGRVEDFGKCRLCALCCIKHLGWRSQPKPAGKATNKRPPEKRVSSADHRERAQRFYRSREWQAARYEALKLNDGRCELCGVGKHDGAVLHVDHIVPLVLDWGRRLDPSNHQVLCAMCNMGKGWQDDTDWREPRLSHLMGEAIDADCLAP